MEKKMNVLMIVSWYTPRGREKLEAGVFHYEQSVDLTKYCNVAIYFPFDQEITESETTALEWGLLTYRSSYTPGKIFRTKNQVKKTMARIIKEFQPDIIHAHCGGAAGFYASFLADQYGIPMVVTEHSPVELSGVNRLSIGHYFSKRAFGHSRANICVSKDSRDKLAAIYPKYSFEVIYNGIILPEYKENTKKHYRDGYVNVVIVAILYDLEIKGMKYLLRAMEILKRRGKKFMLHHIGGGEYLEHFRQMAVDLDIDDICVFHGSCQRSELYEIVNEMDFFVSASLVECSGVSVQEAMLLGKPVLGTNSGGVDSLVPKQAGHIVEKANAQALAEGMEYMERKLDSYDRTWIRDYARESFEIGNISRKYMALYKRILGERE